MSLILGTMHYFQTLADSKKGSLTNRNQAAKEHFKNDFKLGCALYIPATAAAGVIATGNAGKVLAKTGSLLYKATTYIAELAKNNGLGKNLLKIAQKIAANPKAAGLIGLGVLGANYLVSVGSKYANKAGKIDQKYEDAAKIESQTKNVVLEEKTKKADAFEQNEKNPLFC